MTRFDNFEDMRPPGPLGEGERGNPLHGARILIIEDNLFIGSALEDLLTEEGLSVIGVAHALKDALRLSEAQKLDLALLDVNLGGEKIDPVAEVLAARRIPFVFATGYGRAGLPESFSNSPVVEKPFYIEELLKVLRSALRQAKASETASEARSLST